MKKSMKIKGAQNFVLGMIGLFSFTVATFGANSTCFLVANQPELPESVKQLRKF